VSVLGLPPLTDHTHVGCASATVVGHPFDTFELDAPLAIDARGSLIS
jgi:hypothetical protein